jgi:hypothetical protein
LADSTTPLLGFLLLPLMARAEGRGSKGMEEMGGLRGCL